MPSTVWKGHLTFGLISIPVKLFRAARAEKVSFRQLHRADHSRVRQSYVRESASDVYPEPEAREDEDSPSRRTALPAAAPAKEIAAFRGPAPAPSFEREAVSSPEVSRADLVKGYEYARDRYVVVTKDDLAKITPETRQEMQILEFVRLAEIDPVYFETSYYIAPDRAGEKPYALLLQALRETGFVALAQLAMHHREHVVIIRPGRTGMMLHTMFYEDEIRRNDEYRADTAAVAGKELDLAKRLVEALASPFQPAKFKDTYREKLNELISAKIAGEDTYEAPAPKPRSVINILDALQKSLSMTAERKPPAAEHSPGRVKKARGK
jgi:DNA end-binding protein Ku